MTVANDSIGRSDMPLQWSPARIGRCALHHKGTLVKILIVDDHPLVLHALQEVLPQLNGSLEIFGASTRAETLLMLARHPDLSLVLLDLTLPGARGLDLLAELRRDRPLLAIVVLSATHDSATVGAAIAAGARGFVAKTASPHALLDAIETVLEGGRHVTTDLRSASRTINGVSVDILGLTQRQSDVLHLLIQGKPNKLICRDLRLSEGTVKVHVSAILKALNVHSRSQAIVELTRRGISVENSTTS
jgi:DNA-binding NarL/FixJ family response regulator